MAKPGSIGWVDLTVDDASSISDFYCKVAGWRKEPLSMGDYDDFVMSPADSDDPVSGVCHKRGTNAALPGGWMLYIVVDALEDRVALVANSVAKWCWSPKRWAPTVVTPSSAIPPERTAHCSKRAEISVRIFSASAFSRAASQGRQA